MRLQFVLSEMGIGLRRNLSMTVSVVLVTMVSLFFFGFGLLSSAQVSAMKDYWYERVEVSIFMCGETSTVANCADGEVTQAQRAELETQLQSLSPLVQQVYYESKEDAFKRFSEQFKDTSVLDNVKVEQMPESFRVKLSDPTKYDVIASAFTGAPGVEEVQDQRALLANLFKVLNVLTWIARGFAIVMTISALLLVATTVRLSAFSRRRETGIMRLVGASNLLIQLPFVLEAVLATMVGATIATGLLFAGVHFGITGFLSPLLPFFRFITTGDVLAVAPLLYATGLLMAALASFFTLRRYLRV
ncbi:MAG TPA: permease-like cell division protein FtsX [Actinomycetales bacterium]|jgi:cell division transport system permease protein